MSPLASNLYCVHIEASIDPAGKVLLTRPLGHTSMKWYFSPAVPLSLSLYFILPQLYFATNVFFKEQILFIRYATVFIYYMYYYLQYFFSHVIVAWNDFLFLFFCNFLQDATRRNHDVARDLYILLEYFSYMLPKICKPLELRVLQIAGSIQRNFKFRNFNILGLASSTKNSFIEITSADSNLLTANL